MDDDVDTTTSEPSSSVISESLVRLGSSSSPPPMIVDGFGSGFCFVGSSIGSMSPRPSLCPSDSQPARRPLFTTVDNIRSKSSFLI